MDFSSANVGLWNPIVQMGIIAGLILLANTLRQKIRFIRDSLMPTAVLAGFILLLLRTFNIIHVNPSYLESITYHAIALGFIALSLRRPEQQSAGVPPVLVKGVAVNGHRAGHGQGSVKPSRAR